MKKFLRLISLLICMALCLQIVGFEAVAVEIGKAVDGIAALADGEVIASGYCGEGGGTNLTWELTEAGTLTISGDGRMADWGYTTIPWYKQKSSIKSVIIEGNVTSIGDYAFAGCTSLTTVTIPDSVTSISDYVFYNCQNLTAVTIPDSVTSIGSSAFSCCTGLTSVTIPNSVTSIGSSAFSSCTGLTSVTIPNSVTSIGSSAFSDCTGLTSVTIPDSVTSIGKGAFSGCTSIFVDNNNQNYCSFDGVLFTKDMKKLIQYPAGNKAVSYSIPNSVTSIGSSAFSYCTGLTTITIPNSVTSIGSSAFSDCTGLTTITIPNSVTSISNYAFSGCTGLTSVTISDSVTSIGESAFRYCTGLTSVTIPNSVTSIGSYVFSFCTGLTSITIPDSVRSIGDYAFDYCYDLVDIYCEAETKPDGWSGNWNGSDATAHWGWKPCLVRPIFEDKIAFEYSISLPRVTEAPKVIFSIEGKELSSTTATKTEDGRWSFTCFDIMPSQLDSEISITVLGSDIEIPSYSVREYCIERLENSEDETYKQLISELLRYGALAKELETGSASDMADVDNILPVKSNVLSYENKFDISDENNVWKGTTLVLENTITMRLYYNGDIAPDVSAVTCKQHHAVTVNEAKKFIEITGFTPLDYDEAITAKLGDATITYSVGTYIARMSVNGQPLTQRIVEALQNYGRSAEEYAQSSNQNN